MLWRSVWPSAISKLRGLIFCWIEPISKEYQREKYLKREIHTRHVLILNSILLRYVSANGVASIKWWGQRFSTGVPQASLKYSAINLLIIVYVCVYIYIYIYVSYIIWVCVPQKSQYCQPLTAISAITTFLCFAIDDQGERFYFGGSKLTESSA